MRSPKTPAKVIGMHKESTATAAAGEVCEELIIMYNGINISRFIRVGLISILKLVIFKVSCSSFSGVYVVNNHERI